MSVLIQELLTNYYGVGVEKGATTPLSSHQAYFHAENDLRQTISADLNKNFTSEDSIGKNQQGFETRGSDNESEDTECKDKIVRSSRAIDDNEMENIEVPMEESKKIHRQTQDDNQEFIVDDLTTTKVIVVEESDAREESIIEPKAGIGLLEEVLDSASDVSSLSMKKKPQKPPSIASVCTAPRPLIARSSVLRKIPECNTLYFDMSNAGLTQFPMSFLEKIHGIKMLYLEKNELSELPDVLFITLKCLEFLDVRHNRLSSLPATIKNHLSLETILLQGNQFQRLPQELAVIPNLKALQLYDNPLEYPPKNVLNLGFHGIIDFLRREWNSEHPDEAVQPPQEIKSALTILCHDPPPSSGVSKLTKNFSSSSSLDCPNILRKLSVREKSKNYKPSNRYDEKSAKKFALCEDCRDKLNRNNRKYQKIEIKLSKKINGESIETSDDDSLELLSSDEKRDAAILVKLKSVDSDKMPQYKGKLPRIQKISLADEIKRMEDIKVKERMYSIITNSRIMTKLRPMRLKDPDWSLAFIQNYLGIDNRPMGWFPSRRAH